MVIFLTFVLLFFIILIEMMHRITEFIESSNKSIYITNIIILAIKMILKKVYVLMIFSIKQKARLCLSNSFQI